jgi:nicotinamidase-related amidase
MSRDPQLKAESALLVIIDLQVGHLSSIRSMAPDQLVMGVVRLVEIAKAMGIPSILTVSKHAPPQGLLVPELTDRCEEGPIVERTIINAWDDPKVRSLVEQSGRSQSILAGVALDVGVTFAAVGAKRSGLSVIIPIDAVGTTDSRIENATLLNLATLGVLLTSVQAVGMELLGDITREHASVILDILATGHLIGENPFEGLQFKSQNGSS